MAARSLQRELFARLLDQLFCVPRVSGLRSAGHFVAAVAFSWLGRAGRTLEFGVSMLRLGALAGFESLPTATCCDGALLHHWWNPCLPSFNRGRSRAVQCAARRAASSGRRTPTVEPCPAPVTFGTVGNCKPSQNVSTLAHW